MSLVRIAVRHCLVAALAGRTLVGDNVLDSRIGAFDVDADGGLRTPEQRAFLTVYTDAAKVPAGDIDLRQLTGNGVVDILFETGVTEAMLEKDEETGVTTLAGVAIPATDDALEFNLDVVIRQISTALTDPANAWAELFNAFCVRFHAIERARTANERDGVKLAAQQLRITAMLIDDPIAGVPLDAESPFGRFLAMLEVGDPGDQARAAIMRAAIDGTETAWGAVQRLTGMTDDELLALGLGPVAADIDRATPAFAAGTIDRDGVAPATVEP